MSCVKLSLGNIASTVKFPPTFTFSPTVKLLEIPTPPIVVIAPVPTLVESVLLSTIILPLESKPVVFKLPKTSNASVGAVVLIPTFCVNQLSLQFCLRHYH